MKEAMMETDFNDWFSRIRGALHAVAFRVLGSHEAAELATRNCWFTASRILPQFDSEGAFRSWLLRVLIKEALIIKHGIKSRPFEPPRCPAFNTSTSQWQ
jgi:DNA-directed RNA polymerase specialized sigma24 family protein